MCKSKTKSEFTLATLEKYSHQNTSPDGRVLTAVNGTVYDITNFLPSHPGGDLIYLAAGRDSTVLWQTYHPSVLPNSPSSKRMTAILKNLEIGTLNTPESYYTFSSEFYPTLKSRVTTHLKSLNLPLRGGSGSIHLKSLFLLSLFLLSLLSMYHLPAPYSYISSIIMGLTASFIGTCIQHDGSHGSFSSNTKVNKVAGWTLDMIGASAFTWEVQHMLGHHPFTNLLDESTDPTESDPDVFSSYPLMRMHPSHPKEWFHAYQHLYAPILFSFMTLAKVFTQDVQIILSYRLYHIDATCRYGSGWNRGRFWGMKVLSMVYMLVLPIYYQGFAHGIGLFFVGHLACGEMLATMFIVNHVIEGVAFAEKGGGAPKNSKGETTMEGMMKNKKIKTDLNDWAAVQCQTSVNWSPRSRFWNHFSGGLNHQIEHHLFPSICHTNYVHISKIVEETCEEFGVPYRYEKNLFKAYGGMTRHLKEMGNEIKRD
ncbi:hypothetical protein TL16_g07915, partial [Triparma laevis f. inornata]|uniref:Cytochrome b5 heme-binding domain-containing protein n=2 Tax=Triparma laevis TaxID=1534972 RepID=A0A9W7FN02_9STRA